MPAAALASSSKGDVTTRTHPRGILVCDVSVPLDLSGRSRLQGGPGRRQIDSFTKDKQKRWSLYFAGEVGDQATDTEEVSKAVYVTQVLRNSLLRTAPCQA